MFICFRRIKGRIASDEGIEYALEQFIAWDCCGCNSVNQQRSVCFRPARHIRQSCLGTAIPNPLTPKATALVRRANSRTPADTSTIRGANYCYAEFGGHAGMWNNYSPAITERDLTYAQRLGINQIRCFVNYQAYANDPNAFGKNLIHLLRAADERGIGVMPVVGYGGQMLADGHPGAEDWARFLVDTLGQEPGLAFWDVSNEPDYPATPTVRVKTRIAFARFMAGVFRKLDGNTPITIGFAFEPTMEECADDVDVLVFHNYLRTRKHSGRNRSGQEVRRERWQTGHR